MVKADVEMVRADTQVRPYGISKFSNQHNFQFPISFPHHHPNSLWRAIVVDVQQIKAAAQVREADDI